MSKAAPLVANPELTWKAGSHQWPCARWCVCTRAAAGSVGGCCGCGTVPGSCRLGSSPRCRRWRSGGSPPAPRRPAAGARWWPAEPAWSRSTSGPSSLRSKWRRAELRECVTKSIKCIYWFPFHAAAPQSVVNNQKVINMRLNVAGRACWRHISLTWTKWCKF